MSTKLSVDEKQKLATDLAISVYTREGTKGLGILEKQFQTIVETIERLREKAATTH